MKDTESGKSKIIRKEIIKMCYKFYYFFVLLIVHLSTLAYSQDKSSESEQWITIDKDVMYNIVIATGINQQITKGLLYGMKGDSIYLSLRNETIKLNLRDLLSLSIEKRASGDLGLLSGTIGGMYLGSLALLTSKNTSAKYLDYEDGYILALYELGFAVVGGGIGYLIDRKSADQQKIFYFNRDDSGIIKEIKRLKDYLTNSSTSRKVKVNFYLSQVNTRFSEVQNNSNDSYYWNGNYNMNYSELHNFNMLRKLSLTYEAFEQLEIGLALNWFGEPPFYHYQYKYLSDSTVSKTILQYYDGLGYYLVLNFRPFRNNIPDYFDLLVGGGVGFGKVDYHFKNEAVINKPSSKSIVVTNERIIDEALFSSIIMCEMKYFVYPELSVSIQADYIYLPEKMPAIPEFGMKERNLGNFSYGLGFGFNF
jgi:hypothetical protein